MYIGPRRRRAALSDGGGADAADQDPRGGYMRVTALVLTYTFAGGVRVRSVHKREARRPTQPTKPNQHPHPQLQTLERRAMGKLMRALEPDMEDVLACARDAEDRDRQVRWCLGFVSVVGPFPSGGVWETVGGGGCVCWLVGRLEGFGRWCLRVDLSSPAHPPTRHTTQHTRACSRRRSSRCSLCASATTSKNASQAPQSFDSTHGWGWVGGWKGSRCRSVDQFHTRRGLG